MKWLTLTEIGRRAKSKKGALEVSYEHWNQLYQAKAKELRKEYAGTKGYIADADYCGLCNRKRIDGCDSCIFHPHCPCGDKLWITAYDALKDWINKRGSWQGWKRASKAVRDKLKELMESA